MCTMREIEFKCISSYFSITMFAVFFVLFLLTILLLYIYIYILYIYIYIYRWVPSDYYNWTLEQRASMLQAPTTRSLCKSLLLENKKVTPETYNFVYNPRFVLVVLQYDSELDVSLLTKSIRKLQPIVEERLDPSDFDWRVADSDDNDRITGYKFNSVTPFVSAIYLSIYIYPVEFEVESESIIESIHSFTSQNNI